MTTEPQVRYFLGANSSHGFYSLYHQLIDPKEAHAIFLLKGGPGCGKSSLMKRVAELVEDAGLLVEYVRCSGDVHSVDAILMPEKKVAVIDATAPHVVEPQYPGLVEHYVNLGCCYDAKGLEPLRDEILACLKERKEHYIRAYHCLNAVAQIEEDRRAVLATPQLEERMAKRVKGILSRELKGKGKGAKPGAVRQRFLSGITHDGLVCWFDTVDAQCTRVYELVDSYGLSHLMLNHLLTGIVAAGYDVVACPCPLFPDRLEHLIIPDLSLAFVTSSPMIPYPGVPLRRIRLDAMTDAELLRRHKPRLRFSKKVSGALLEEAIVSLAQAKEAHDRLEKLYNPHVDFDQVYKMADELAERVLAI